MAPDWFTLIAQIVNFLLLVWLLKHYLFARVVRAMNEREASIASRLEAAARTHASAEQEAETFRTRNREFEEERDEMLARAREEAASHRQQLLEAARRDVDNAQAEWLAMLNREREDLLLDFRERLSGGVVAVARQGLRQLASADLERQILDNFEGRLRTLDAAEREAIAAALRDSDHAVEIRTAFPLLPEAQERLSRSVHEQLGDGVGARFVTAPELICGIELRAHAYHLTWNLDAYLEDVEARVFETLEESVREHEAAR
ncbi:MAG: F0F1 ATP synthase subunit B [Burkholderiales bacterium]|nr:F0F1 ATP synthase subunit B [Burkholderiales bacterium]